jgi:short-subunit dehydrogenase
MKFTDQIAMVTGANGGIGSAIVNELLKTDVKKIYACARNTDNLKGMFNDPRVQAVQLDITKSESIKDAVNNCADITVLINNSGLAKGGLINNLDNAKTEIEVNYFGTHAMCSAFAPVLAKNNGGYIVNILSLLSFVNMPSIGTYSASKAALHSFTQGLRGVLAKQNTKVIGVYPGPVATRATEGLEMPMADANDVAKEIVAGIIAEQEEIFPDKMAKDVMAGLAVNPKSVEREFGSY